MRFDPTKAAIRFGEGLSPDIAPLARADDLLASLDTDQIAQDFPIRTFSQLSPSYQKLRDLRVAYRKGRDTDAAKDLQRAFRRARGAHNRALLADFRQLLNRSIQSEAPFRERLARFWGDHFTVEGRTNETRFAVPHFVEEAIRPRLNGRFADMLRAVVMHPMMLAYLDQNISVGPNSAGSKGGKRGINENFARELLELHTLGVDGGYSQKDVRQLAELLTGLSINKQYDFVFRPKIAEPGAEQVLGKSYGNDTPDLGDIEQVIEDLASHPSTARHLARKLAVHFTSDAPDASLIAAMEATYLDTKGELNAVYATMLDHPATWSSFGEKIKQPIDFIASSLRALAVPSRVFEGFNRRQLQAYLGGPMAAMGQTWLRPDGPDGWEEEAQDWITPQGLAARVQWALAAPSAFYKSLPDPRDFVQTALGDIADERVQFAAKAAETRREGVGLILASPAFQRR